MFTTRDEIINANVCKTKGPRRKHAFPITISIQKQGGENRVCRFVIRDDFKFAGNSMPEYIGISIDIDSRKMYFYPSSKACGNKLSPISNGWYTTFTSRCFAYEISSKSGKSQMGYMWKYDKNLNLHYIEF